MSNSEIGDDQIKMSKGCVMIVLAVVIGIAAWGGWGLLKSVQQHRAEVAWETRVHESLVETLQKEELESLIKLDAEGSGQRENLFLKAREEVLERKLSAMPEEDFRQFIEEYIETGFAVEKPLHYAHNPYQREVMWSCDAEFLEPIIGKEIKRRGSTSALEKVLEDFLNFDSEAGDAEMHMGTFSYQLTRIDGILVEVLDGGENLISLEYMKQSLGKEAYWGYHDDIRSLEIMKGKIYQAEKNKLTSVKNLSSADLLSWLPRAQGNGDKEFTQQIIKELKGRPLTSQQILDLEASTR